MPRTGPLLPLEMRRILRKLGADIRDARRRRRWTMALVSERAYVTPPTLGKVERGDPRVSLGIYATVLWVLGMGARLGDLADVREDETGLRLEEERLPQRVVPPRARRPAAGGESA